MTDFHVITPESAELVMQVIDSQLIIVPSCSSAIPPKLAEAQEISLEVLSTNHIGAPAR